MPSNPSIPTLEIGSTLAHFQLLEVLGEGGMGIVFLAQDTIARRQVALKVMQPHLAKQGKSKERFLREARLAASVEHDRIVRLYEVNEDRGIPYIAMELLKGQSLDKILLENQPLPLSFIFRVIRHVAEGLAVAHEKGLIHRDIKPSNIWLEPYEGSFRCKTLDFGLARIVEGDSISTQSGQIMGSPNYMSPEQWKGKEVDSRTDLYSLGIMLYQMTTGKTPFVAENPATLMYQVLMEEAESPSKLNPQLPAKLCDLIQQLLAKEKEKRPAKAQEIVRTLDQISKQVTDFTQELVGLPPEAIFFADTLPGRESDTHRLKKSGDSSTDFPTIALPPPPVPSWIPWLGMLVGLVVGIGGIVIGTQKQTAPELAPLLRDKNRLEERLKQLETELAEKGTKTPQEIEADQKRLAEYASLVKEKQKLEAKLLEEQKSASKQKSRFEKMMEKQKEDLVSLQKEKQKVEEMLAKVSEKGTDFGKILSEKKGLEEELKKEKEKVRESLTQLTEADKQEKIRKRESDQLTKEKEKLENEITLLNSRVNSLKKEKDELAKQIVKKPEPLNCTGTKGADEKMVIASQKAWANYLRVPIEETIRLGNGTKMEFVFIPPGKFLMGASKEEHNEYLKMQEKGEDLPKRLAWELPQHEVIITKPFYLGKYEVTQEEYTTLTKLQNPSQFQNGKSGTDKNTNRYPVDRISWEDAQAFIKFMRAKPSPRTIKTISLPTESQWEYAARAGTRTFYSFGNELNGKEANSNGKLPFGTTTKGEYLQRTQEVGRYQPNAFGLYDMHGNVEEWCLDGFDEKAYINPKKENPFTGHSNNTRVLRGGSWSNNSGNCRSACRNRFPLSYRNLDLGFRLVLLLED